MFIDFDAAYTGLLALQAREWIWIIIASWLVAACVIAVPLGKAIDLADERETVKTLYRPPVPPPALTPSEVDARIEDLELLWDAR